MPDASRCRWAPASGSRAATTTSSGATTSGTTGAAARCSSRCPTRSSAPPEHQPAATRLDYDVAQQPPYENVMGRTPSGRRDPNGTDFWWDSSPATRGTAGTTTPASGGRRQHHDAARPAPVELQEDPAWAAPREAELARCIAALDGAASTSTGCVWYTTPARAEVAAGPGGWRARRSAGRLRRRACRPCDERRPGVRHPDPARDAAAGLRVTASPAQRSRACSRAVKRGVSGGRPRDRRPVGQDGNVLDDDRAYRPFEARCRPDFAKRSGSTSSTRARRRSRAVAGLRESPG